MKNKVLVSFFILVLSLWVTVKLSQESQDYGKKAVDYKYDSSFDYQVHLDGGLIGSQPREENFYTFSLPFVDTRIACILGLGNYLSFSNECYDAWNNSLDSIAIGTKTRLIFYPKKNFEGDPVLDIVGPAIVYNKFWEENNVSIGELRNSPFGEPYQTVFSPKVRYFSCSYMSLSSVDTSLWSNGSFRVLAYDKEIPPSTIGICETPTLTPTSIPTPTVIPKTWENICKSVLNKTIIPTFTPTPTIIPTNTPTPTLTLVPTMKPLCESCFTENVNYEGPDRIGADYDCNGIVNGADYVVWRNEFVDKVGTMNSDGNCDGKVTTSDYSRWRENYIK